MLLSIYKHVQTNWRDLCNLLSRKSAIITTIVTITEKAKKTTQACTPTCAAQIKWRVRAEASVQTRDNLGKSNANGRTDAMPAPTAVLS